MEGAQRIDDFDGLVDLPETAIAKRWSRKGAEFPVEISHGFNGRLDDLATRPRSGTCVARGSPLQRLDPFRTARGAPCRHEHGIAVKTTVFLRPSAISRP